MTNKRYPKILAIVGPTAVGKTELSIRLASKIDGEIVVDRAVAQVVKEGARSIFDSKLGAVNCHLGHKRYAVRFKVHANGK